MSKPPEVNVPITIGDVTVEPGRRQRFELPVSRLPTGSWASLPIAVVNGRRPGPTVWLSGAVHGDEINGVEIVRRVLRQLEPRSLRGAVIAVPIVNVFGFLIESRYLPDRRDLNRSFPGSERGSLAARLAHLFMTEVVGHASVGIDLHTAAGHRTNVPQVRGDLEDPETLRLARAFGAPFLIHAKLRDGSLREAATSQGRRVLLYEAGQVHRFDEDAISVGTDGVLRTLAALGMGSWDVPEAADPIAVERTRWVRTRRAGIATIDVALGQHVVRGELLGTVSDAFGSRPTKVTAPMDGWVIARTLSPLVSQGDAFAHIAAGASPLVPDPTKTRLRKVREESAEGRVRARRGPELDR